MYQKKIPEDLDCGIILAGKVLSGKWKPCIIDGIAKGINRPGALQKAIPEAPARVIKMQLKELEHYGVVYKNIHPGFPLKVEYFLTPEGEALLPIISMMESWGIANKHMIVSAEERPLQSGTTNIRALTPATKSCMISAAQ